MVSTRKFILASMGIAMTSHPQIMQFWVTLEGTAWYINIRRFSGSPWLGFPRDDQVPKNLEERDIQEAFEDIGRVTKCEASWAWHKKPTRNTGEMWVEAA